jgi:glycosyltransferase involved in cell wall biosynthesis
MKSPSVSIVVPVYNGAAYLGETLDSLLAQSFGDFELLVIDDGSTDASSEVVRSRKDERIRLIRKENGGLCHALNRGIEEARAPYIARNDQDDISFPHRLERQMQVMKEHSEAMGMFAYNTKFGARHRWSNSDKLTMASGRVREYAPIEDGSLLGSTMFVRTEALRAIHGFRQSYYPVDDWDLECRLAQEGTLLVLQEPLVAYRFQTSANTYRVFAEMQEKTRWTEDSYRRRLRGVPELTFDQFIETQPKDRWSRLARRRIDTAKLQMRTAGQEYLDGRYFSAATHLSVAFVLDPADMARRVGHLLSRSA